MRATITTMTDDQLHATALAFIAARDEETAAKEALESARQERTAAAAKVAEARGPLVEQILNEVRAGVRQRDIVRRINNAYTRERVRQICRAAGIEPVE